ncbi:MAG: DNA primase [Anaerolineales bacterium]|nr:DNA primase [Anaerolineales bacterium]MCW5855142.1 DNA primase [Anaerolineales bacterium]
MSSIEEIKARIDIADLVSETVQLRRAGKNFTGLCPFHSNTRTPSFVVFPDSGTWRCFGQCNEGGDVFKFVMKKEGWDFPEALRRLAERAGVQLRAPSPMEQAAKEQHTRLRELLEATTTFFRQQLLSSEAGKAALGYIRGRGLSDATIEAFGLGYAPDSFNALSDYLADKGYSPAEMLEAGVASERDGRQYDRFRNRLIFPIRDSGGRMAGFGARALRDGDQPKYLNSPQTPLFDKGALLYGLDRARKTIRDEDQAVLVEGYMDVIGLHQAGFSNAVSPMGTAINEGQLRVLKRLSKRIVLALDADAAGNQATLRGLQVARQALDREEEIVFDARGLLRHEARLQADIRVITLPPDTDPDELVQSDPEEWPRLLAAARPVVEHVMLSLAAGQDLNDPKAKRSLAEQVMPLIGDLPSPIERDTYTQKLARLLQVDERSLVSERPARRPASRPRPRRPAAEATQASPAPAEATNSDPNFKLEKHILAVIIRTPELLYRVNRSLQQAKLPRLSSGDFQHSEMQEMFRLSLESLEQDLLEPSSYALQNLPLPLLDRADEMLMNSQEMDPNAERVFEDLLRSILMLRRRNLYATNEQMRYLQAAAQEEGDLKASEYAQVMLQNTLTLQRLDKALAGDRKLASTR